MEIIAFIHQSITLPCTIRTPESTYVRWADRIYNTSPDPQLIYDSRNSPALEDSHPHSYKYSVNSDYELVINNVSQADAGVYVCEVGLGENAEPMSKRYSLMAVSEPECSGKTAINENEQTTLTCMVPFSGNQLPIIDWYHGEEEMASSDLSEIMLLRKALQIEGTKELDQEALMCKLTIADIMKSCTMTLDVSYPTREINVVEEKASYAVGEEVECSADGNPPPMVKWAVDDTFKVRQGEGWAIVTIPERWEGEEASLVCTASSTSDPDAEPISRNITFSVTAAAPVKGGGDPSEPAESSAGSSKSAGIIGGVIAAIVVVIIIVAVIFLFRQRNKKPKDQEGSKAVPTNV